MSFDFFLPELPLRKTNRPENRPPTLEQPESAVVQGARDLSMPTSRRERGEGMA